MPPPNEQRRRHMAAPLSTRHHTPTKAQRQTEGYKPGARLACGPGYYWLAYGLARGNVTPGSEGINPTGEAVAALYIENRGLVRRDHRGWWHAGPRGERVRLICVGPDEHIYPVLLVKDAACAHGNSEVRLVVNGLGLCDLCSVLAVTE